MQLLLLPPMPRKPNNSQKLKLAQLRLSGSFLRLTIMLTEPLLLKLRLILLLTPNSKRYPRKLASWSMPRTNWLEHTNPNWTLPRTIKVRKHPRKFSSWSWVAYLQQALFSSSSTNYVVKMKRRRNTNKLSECEKYLSTLKDKSSELVKVKIND